ncbi:PspC domain-containing protein [Patescibacteria group bacterium]|nr:PspC domain-containing protein [Patescibacteria group bacterium]
MEHKKNIKKLYRSHDNKICAGVIGGLGEYFSIDPVLLRVVWVFILIFTGIVPGLIVYLITMFIVPLKPSAH